MMTFTEFPPCKHRFGCVECRNNPTFLDKMKKRVGEWECPEKIPIKTTLDQMPVHIQKNIASYQSNRTQPAAQSPAIQTPHTAQVPNMHQQPKTFTELPQCIHRMTCLECRTNDKFREQMEAKFGKWECPINIAIGTPLEEMPEEIQTKIKQRQEQIKIQQARQQKAKDALNLSIC